MAGRRSHLPHQSARARAAVVAVGACVRELRRAAGWTLERAAEQMDLDLRHLQKVEAGQTTATIATLVRIADALGVSPGLLFMPPTANAPTTEPQAPSAPQPASAAPGTAQRKRPAGPTPARLSKHLGTRVVELRHERGWTQAALAARAEVAVQHLQRIEAGRQNPTLHVMARLASALGVTLPALLGES